MRALTVAVAGCGPGGLATALLLNAQGHRVTMFERFATAGPVGSGLMLQPTGLAVLAQLGLAETALARGSRITRLYGLTDAGRVALAVRYPGERFGVGIHRATLFEILHDAAVAAGISIVTGRTITGSASGSGGRTLSFAECEAAGPFDLVVDMLGARSPLTTTAGRPLAYGALWTNVRAAPAFAEDMLEQRYRGAGIMAGVLPVGLPPGATAPYVSLFWSLRADRLAAWREAGLERWRDEFLTLWPAATPLLAQIDDPARLTFAHYAHRTLRRPAAERLIHLGDAWHATSPQLGQGANMALLDAFALSVALAEHDDMDAALAGAVRLRRSHVRLYQAISRIFTPAYQSDGRTIAWLRDRLVRPLGAFPPTARLQAALVSGTVGDPLGRLGLA